MFLTEYILPHPSEWTERVHTAYLLAVSFDAGVLFLGLGLDGGGRLDGVILLDIGGRSGDGPPGFAARHADSYCDNGHNEKLFHKGEFWMPNSIRR